MKRRDTRRVRGMTMIETLIAGLMSVMVGAGLWTLIRSSYDSEFEIMDQNANGVSIRQVLDDLTDHLRGAQKLTAASYSDLTYLDSSGQSVRYWKSGTNLMKTVNSLPAGGTVVVSGVKILSFTYYEWNGSAWASSPTPTDPTKVGRVDISTTVQTNSITRQLTGSVRVRAIVYP